MEPRAGYRARSCLGGATPPVSPRDGTSPACRLAEQSRTHSRASVSCHSTRDLCHSARDLQ
eukprot:4461236-Prymnesium_polylepis.1